MNKYYAGVRMLELDMFAGGGFYRAESLSNIPFEIKRIFYIFGRGNCGTIRGKHSNKKSEFVMFNVKGKCKVKIIDENRNEVTYKLNEPGHALYLPKMVWKEMYDFSEDAVLMVLTNEYYDATEYIRDFEEFIYEMNLLNESI